MVIIFPYSIGGIFMPAKRPFGLFESSAACNHKKKSLSSSKISIFPTIKEIPKGAAVTSHMPQLPTRWKL
jgi:hypothetical protein